MLTPAGHGDLLAPEPANLTGALILCSIGPRDW